MGIVNTEAASRRSGFQYVSGGVIEASPNLVKAIPIPQASPSEKRRVRRLALALEGLARKLSLDRAPLARQRLLTRQAALKAALERLVEDLYRRK